MRLVDLETWDSMDEGGVSEVGSVDIITGSGAV
jgi:hypothetical protein